MCGISGLLTLGSSESFCDLSAAIKTLDLQWHRGPDDRGISFFSFPTGRREELNENMAVTFPASGYLGFNRLSIQDLSSNGHQPMVGRDGKVILAFNGEIYNMLELKQELVNSCGCTFHSKADTEIILRCYEAYGIEETLKKLNGMFAITIVDLRTRKLYLARDRFGIKPLYYGRMGNNLIFASEVKSFLGYKQFHPRLNIEALKEYFTFGESLGGGLLDGIKELEPGTYMECVQDGGEPWTIKPYFNLDMLGTSAPCKRSMKDAAEEMEALLYQCVKRQMAGDVRVGCQLSGGIDSSLIALSADALGLKDTFSIIPDEPFFSEESFMDQIIGKTGMRPHKYGFSQELFLKNLKKSVWHYESILTYHNFTALMHLTEKARDEVTVLLSGEGADEILGGYTWFEDGWFASQYLSQREKGLERQWEFERRVRGLDGADTFGDFAIRAADVIPEEDAFSFLGTFDRKTIIQKRLELFEGFHGSDFSKQRKYEMATRMRGLLTRQDKASMANSIENRVPFLDNEFVEFAFTLPENYLLYSKNGSGWKSDRNQVTGKYLLKKISADFFGKDFAFRRKMGFPISFHEYMFSEEFANTFYEAILPPMRERGIFQWQAVEKAYKNGDLTRNRWEFMGLWKAINTELWCQCFLDRTE